ncbi:hypothetical protein [Streptomyces sp. NBC_00414]|uniref:hypothetical protein n=1 Tax=Streptomyces sp. NBC_00414 TaxID=2975739 RepID=UPI002E246962
MSWTRAFLTALAVCALFGALLVGATGCGSDGAREDDKVRPSPVGKVLKDRDEEGRHYREIDEESAPEVAIEIQPAADDADAGADEGADTDGDDGWDVRLTVHDFRFSPAGTEKKAEPGRGYAMLRLDGRPLSVLRGPDHHLAGDIVSRGTHQVTVRLHADDDTVWAVDGEPVASTADITVSDPGPPHGKRTTPAPPPTTTAPNALAPPPTTPTALPRPPMTTTAALPSPPADLRLLPASPTTLLLQTVPAGGPPLPPVPAGGPPPLPAPPTTLLLQTVPAGGPPFPTAQADGPSPAASVSDG